MKEALTLHILGALVLYFIVPSLNAQDVDPDKTEGKQAQEYFRLSQEAFDQQDYPQTLKHLNKVLQLKPGYYRAYYYRAMVKEQTNESLSALTDYNIYLEYFPNDFEALFGRAVLRYELKKYKQAQEDFSKLLYLPSGETNTIVFRSSLYEQGVDKVMTSQKNNRAYLYHYMGLTYAELGDATKSIQFLDTAILLQPGEADYYISRGKWKETFGNQPGAITDYEMALKTEPNNSLAEYNLAILNSLQNQGSKGEDYFSSVIEADPSLPYPYLQRAYQRLNQGKLEGALADYNQALKIDPGNAEALLNRGITKLRMRKFSSAVEDFKEALALDPGLEKAWLSRGTALYELGDYQGAVENYEMALFYRKDYAMAYYNRAVAYHKMGMVDRACEDIKTAERLGVKKASATKHKICPKN